RLPWCGLFGIEPSQRCLLPAGGYPVAPVAEAPLERHKAPVAPFLDADEQVEVVGAVRFDPEASCHRPGEFGVLGYLPAENRCAGMCLERDGTRSRRWGGREAAVAGEVQRRPLRACQRPLRLFAHGGYGGAVFAHLQPYAARWRAAVAVEHAAEECELL